MQELRYITAGGIAVLRRSRAATAGEDILALRRALDTRRGAVFSSNYEYPGRYSRWDFGFVDPPLAVTAKGRAVEIAALNARGAVLLPAIEAALSGAQAVATLSRESNRLLIRVNEAAAQFTEEERIHQPTAFSIVRLIVALFRSEDDTSLGLAGAFGYDLAFQFDPVKPRLKRPDDLRDLVLYLPDEMIVVDHYAGTTTVHSYEFEVGGTSTDGLPRDTVPLPFRSANHLPMKRDHQPGEYAAAVARAKDYFARGDLFETVPGQTFFETCPKIPSALSLDLSATNPSPYGFMINLGEREYLIGASPEMFVRVTGRRVETCPISGTIRRGEDAIADAEQIRLLLNSAKDEAELTMCSDVDRNDKSRVCDPATIRVIGRRQIEMYSRLIHTVDHIEGYLSAGHDALDAFLSHAWAVTVTGAPKLAAMQFLEDHEKSPRAWYGGAVGMVGFNGDLNTGLTLRTIRLKDGIAEVRAGATLLFDSVPDDEERETELKASAMLAVLTQPTGRVETATRAKRPKLPPLKVLLIDHQDSFVHTLAGYLRVAGATVTTVRNEQVEHFIASLKPDLVVLSPGPGRPDEFNLRRSINAARAAATPIFGVCLGLQGITEALGGALDQLPIPWHGKASAVSLGQSALFEGLPGVITVGRYHSLVARESVLPADLRVTARTEDGVIMAIEHRAEPITAVQFHPESIMTLGGSAGMRIIENALWMAAAVQEKRG
jgi:anthranilate synthase